MKQPETLTKETELLWSPGKGTDVWQILCACAGGDLDSVRHLLARDSRLAQCHYSYRTPIYFAVRENQLEVAEYLLDHDADPLSLAVNDSLLEIARDRGYGRMEQLLASRIASLHNASGHSEPVAEAIRNRDLDEIRALLDASPHLLHEGDQRGNQPIHWAVMTRQIEMIDELIARGADINAKRFDGARPVQLVNGDYHYRGWRDVPKEVATTPGDALQHLRKRGAHIDICTAAHLGDLDRVRELLDHDPSLANRLSDYVTYYLGSGSPLKNAAARGHYDVARLLLERGADPNLREEGIAPHGHALYSAVYNGHYDMARLLLEHGAYPNPEVESSADALSIALSHGDDRIVELLCSYGAARSLELLAHYRDLKTAAAILAVRPDLADDRHAFSAAAGNGHKEFVDLMLRYKADLPRAVSLWAKDRDLTEYLFSRGMDPNTTDWLEISPLHEFARKGHVEAATLFLEHGADLHARDEDLRSTPLAWAAKFGQLAMVEFLLNQGAMPVHPGDPPWATPLAWAERRRHPEIVRVLQQALAAS